MSDGTEWHTWNNLRVDMLAMFRISDFMPLWLTRTGAQ